MTQPDGRGRQHRGRPRFTLPRYLRIMWLVIAMTELSVGVVSGAVFHHPWSGLAPAIVAAVLFGLICASSPQRRMRDPITLNPDPLGTPDERARALLKQWLSPEQLKSYQERQEFDVKGSDGHLYTIHCEGSISGNVVRHGRGIVGETRTLCAAPEGAYNMPYHDTYLAQAMALSVDAKRFTDAAVIQARYDRHAGRPHIHRYRYYH